MVALALWATADPARAQAPPPPQDDKAEKKKQDLSDLNLEELLRTPVDHVVGASRYEQKIADAPATVTVITSDEIKRYGYRTLSDILRSIRGVTVTNDRNYSYVGVRGFGLPADYNNRVLFLIDGHRINDNVYGGAYIGNEFLIDVDTIERVEFVRGPASSLYGSNAFFGVVNISTKKAPAVRGVEASASVASFGTYKGRVSAGGLLAPGLEGFVTMSYFDSAGQTLHFEEFDAPATGNGFVQDADSEYSVNVFGRLTYGDFQLEAGYVTREKRVPTAPYGSLFPTRHTETWDSRGIVDLRFERDFEDKLHVLARVFFDSYWYHADYVYPDLLGNPFDNKDYALGYGWGLEVLATKSFLEDRIKATVGSEFRDDFKQDQRNWDDTTPRATYLDSQEQSTVAAVFGQADVLLAPGLRLNAGLRYDHYESFGGTVNPRAGLIYSPAEGTVLKALYGRAFRAPTAYELFYSDGNLTTKANPDLDPEVIDTFELALEQALGGPFQLTAAGFYYGVRDLIVAKIDPSDGLQFFDNVDHVRAVGGELELQATLENGTRGRLSYTAQTAQDRAGWLSNSPHQLVKLNVSVPLIEERLFGSAEVQYVGRRKSLAHEEVGQYAVVNATLFAREVAKGLELSASVYNLLDKRYSDPGGPEHVQDELEQDGLSFRLKLTYRF